MYVCTCMLCHPVNNRHSNTHSASYSQWAYTTGLYSDAPHADDRRVLTYAHSVLFWLMWYTQGSVVDRGSRTTKKSKAQPLSLPLSNGVTTDWQGLAGRQVCLSVSVMPSAPTPLEVNRSLNWPQSKACWKWVQFIHLHTYTVCKKCFIAGKHKQTYVHLWVWAMHH